LGEWYAARGLTDRAIHFLERARELGSKVSAISLARCYWERGDLEAAQRELRRAAAEGLPEPYAQLCLRALESDRSDNAKRHYSPLDWP
jgi:TPR repeat protein